MAWDSDEYFKRMMKRFFKDLENLEKELEIPEKWLKREKPEFTIRPEKVEKRTGFSISISSNGRNPPKIEMKRFGPRGWERVPVERGEIAPLVKIPKEKPSAKISEAPERALPDVKEKLIPDYDVSVDIEKVTITLKAAGVETRENVRVKFYPESVEIYAISPRLNKGYFCTVAVPASVDKSGAVVDVEKERVIIRIPRRLSVM